ncbi:MAG: EamA family transporter [Candidatus Diapherotrites archaeon]|nr:EamA family transporter [Candidatus Diapherotrites archaeon]
MQGFMFLALVAALFFTFSSFLDKFILTHKLKNADAYFILQGIASFLLYPILLFFSTGISIPNAGAWPFIAVSGITAAIGLIIYYRLMGSADYSAVSPLMQARILFTIPLSYFILQEFYGLNVLAFMLLIFAGSVLLTVDEKSSLRTIISKNRVLATGLLICLIWAFSNLLSKPVLQALSVENFIFWRNVFSFAVVIAMLPVLLRGRAREVLAQDSRKALPYVILLLLVAFAGMQFMFYAMKYSVSITESLLGVIGLMAIALAFLLSRTNPEIIAEKHSAKIYALRALGALLVLIGIFNILGARI